MTTSNPKLAQAANAKRSKELDAREQYLDERERLLNAGPLDLTVLEKTIAARKRELLVLKEGVDRADRDFADHKAKLDAAKDQLVADLDAHKQLLKAKKEDVRKVEAAIAEHKAALEALENEIADRQHYLERQEELIKRASDAGNEELVSLKYQIEEQERQKKHLTLLMADLNREKATLEASLEPITQKATQLQQTYEQAAANLRKILDDMREKIAAAANQHKRINAETEEKLKTLKIHEEKVLAEREAIKTERLELDTDKRRWSSTKGLYKLE